jgi:hypothetical protein
MAATCRWTAKGTGMPVYRIGSKNVLFIHIPKTAGMAIDAQLAQHGRVVFEKRLGKSTFNPRHLPATMLEDVFLPEMIDYAFMVVRHPVARLISEYRYQRRHRGFHLSRLRMFGFDIWLRHALWRAGVNTEWRDGHFRPQVEYECFDCEVFRFEDGLERVMQGISRTTGVDIPVLTPPRNVSTYRPVTVSAQSLELIARFYAPDFARFGYAVEIPSIKGVSQATQAKDRSGS